MYISICIVGIAAIVATYIMYTMRYMEQNKREHVFNLMKDILIKAVNGIIQPNDIWALFQSFIE